VLHCPRAAPGRGVGAGAHRAGSRVVSKEDALVTS